MFELLSTSAVHVLLLGLLLRLSVAPIEASINILDGVQHGRGVITVTLSDLENSMGVLSHSGVRCDQQSECDPYFRVTVTDENTNELLSAETITWRNQNNLPFVFFKQSLTLNESLPSNIRLSIVAMDDHMTGDQIIGEFEHEIRLDKSNRPAQVRLFSTAENQFVKLTAQVEVTCAQFYFGPACTEFCRATANLTACMPDGSLVCLDGSMECLRPVREGKSVSTVAEQIKVPRTLIYWVIPSVCFGLLVAVLMGLLVKLVRAQSDKIIVTAPVDNQRFRNPVYSALRTNATVINDGPSISAGTQSTVASDSAAATEDQQACVHVRSSAAAAVTSSEVNDTVVADIATDEYMYEELDEVFQSEANVVHNVAPTAEGRPLPTPGTC